MYTYFTRHKKSFESQNNPQINMHYLAMELCDQRNSGFLSGKKNPFFDKEIGTVLEMCFFLVYIQIILLFFQLNFIKIPI
jgi:hypothetical protein